MDRGYGAVAGTWCVLQAELSTTTRIQGQLWKSPIKFHVHYKVRKVPELFPNRKVHTVRTEQLWSDRPTNRQTDKRRNEIGDKSVPTRAYAVLTA